MTSKKRNTEQRQPVVKSLKLTKVPKPIQHTRSWQLFIAFNLFPFIGYHGSSSSIKCHVYHPVGGRHTPVVCDERREPHTSHYPSNKNTNQQTTHTSHYPSRLVEIFKATMKYRFF